MTLDETVLQKLADWRPVRGNRQTLAVPDEGAGWAVSLTVDRHDELSSALWEIGLQRVTPAPSGASLQTWANMVASRVTGLLESLRVVEVDTERNEALLRSQEPTRRGNNLFYYEVLLKGIQAATFRRYQGNPGGGRRDQVVFVLTHEALAKLVRDLAGA